VITFAPNHGPTRESNACHTPSGPTGGQFCGTGAGSGNAVAARPVPVTVNTVGEAVKAILAGKVVVLKDTRSVNTILTKLARIALDAEKKGKDAPNYNLCNVSVAGTNVFCAKGLKTKEYPNGVPRIDMPQLKGGIADFRQYLKTQGITSERQTVSAASLKATQNELIGSKVAAFMVDKKLTASKRSDAIFVSSDGYVVDGHHRWAAMVGRDAKDGHLGDFKMKVVRINAPISELLKVANTYTKKRGFAGVAGVTH
jgi:hypothetical protein